MCPSLKIQFFGGCGCNSWPEIPLLLYSVPFTITLSLKVTKSVPLTVMLYPSFISVGGTLFSINIPSDITTKSSTWSADSVGHDAELLFSRCIKQGSLVSLQILPFPVFMHVVTGIIMSSHFAACCVLTFTIALSWITGLTCKKLQYCLIKGTLIRK